MAYVYAHVRLDKGEVFYIGVGADSKGKHLRSRQKYNRNKYWHNVYKKTKIHIEILHDNISYVDAQSLEILYIALYKRKKEGGSLVNLTAGGEGTLGVKRPHLLAINKARNHPIYGYSAKDYIGVFESVRQIAAFHNKTREYTSQRIKNGKLIDGLFYTRTKQKTYVPGENT